MSTYKLSLDKINRACSVLPGYCQSYINEVISSVKLVSAYNYISDLTSFISWGIQKHPEYNITHPSDMPLKWFSDLTESDIKEYLEYLTEYKSAGGKIKKNGIITKRRKLSSIRALYKYLNREYGISKDPTEILNRPLTAPVTASAQKEAVLKAITTGEGYGGVKQNKYSMALSTNLRQRNKAIYLLVTELSVKMQYIPLINISDVDLDKMELRVASRKYKDQYTSISISDSIRDALSDYIEGDRKIQAKESAQALFLTSRGERLALRSVQHMIKHYTKFALPDADRKATQT